MLRVTLRNLFARKIRLILSASAIVIGVAFVAGTLVFTDTMGKSFDDIVKGSTSDVTVRPTGSGSWNDTSASIDTRTISAATLHRLEGTPGAARVDGNVAGQGLFVVGTNGKLVGGTGAPTLSFNYNDAPAITGQPALVIEKGHPPHGAHQVALDAKTAKTAGYRLGDTVSMITSGARAHRSATLVGITQFGGGGLAGASLVLFDTPTAQQLFLHGRDAYTAVSLTAKPGVSQTELAANARALLPDGLEAVTGDKVAQENLDAIGKVLNFLNIFLLVFAAIALVVGTFLIVNTFSILVAQRSRELALLRALGAGRRQVTRSVLVEALAVGIVGATLGLLGGFGLAWALKALFGSFGLDLSGTPLVFSLRTVLVSYAVGIVVTVVAAYLPARRAAKIPPVAAMRDDVAMPESSVHRRLLIGIALAVVGGGLMAAGLLGSGGRGAALVGVGVFAILLAVAMMSPVLGRPVLHGLGGIYRTMFGTVGVLATENSLRNPRRTAATASALMIGLTLVTTMSVIGASVNKSIEAGVNKQFTTDFLMSNPVGQSFSATIADKVRKVEGVGAVTETQWVPTTIDGKSEFLTVSDGAKLQRMYHLKAKKGTLDVGKGQIALSTDGAKDYHAHVGDTLTLAFPKGPQKTKVVGIYAKSDVIGDTLVPFSLVKQAQLPRFDNTISVDAADGASATAVGKRLTELVKDVPTVNVQTKQEFSKAQRSSVNQLLYLIYALLGLAIVIAVLGIVNTLALSVIERTREVGLLRAVGLSRRQLRRMVRLESIAIAVLGAVLGVVMGLGFGVVLQQAVADQGITELAIPIVRLVVFVVIAAVVGVLAAVFPARRAAKLNVLRAITTE
ncbi:MAG TPA: FtsX-like permease family protein [Nocardioidaceae bacterium]|nr:FtsX-like permease family protein [Nocardioidaceae bacterium]